jgi:hypothetical protein
MLRNNPSLSQERLQKLYREWPHLKPVSPSARKQLGIPPIAKPLPVTSRRRLLATLRDDAEFAKFLRGGI